MTNPLFECELTPEQMLDNLPAFFEKLNSLARDIGLELTEYQADHIAMRINDNQLTDQAHQAWLKFGTVISSAYINGRPIIVLEFTKPISIQNWAIECLELPYPAKGKQYPNQGWEHVEFVIPSDAKTAKEYLKELKSRMPRLLDAWDRMESMGINIKLSSPKGEGERLANPTVAFKRDGVCIKLHPHALKQVVLSEQ
ncbi:VOC family protein [Vibrio algarum]|uniref:VOC family protein n=1 Tax=Vibrio algarum TaxID=3020714 RepID=A0ABT4YPG5_9VIBR|nr:VOC family protein [Vibrio sp. KJ40-1]MDB1123446.1 VOC family protein [Vibrio sp. KJ40-1]